MKKVITKLAIVLTALVMALGFTGCGTSNYGASGRGYYDNYYDYNPVWAPDYYYGTRYYYFPDIETYYDLATRNFVYLLNGQWLFVPTLPPVYSAFNLRNAFVVIVNRDVYNPWMHHHYYNSHYPRYYYIDYYDFSNIPYVRGYNENGRRAVYWREAERSRAREWGDRSIREGRDFRYSAEDKRVQQEVTRRVTQRTAISPDELRQIGNTDEGRMTSRDAYPVGTRSREAATRTTPTTTRQTTSPTDSRRTTSRSAETNYYGGSIGQPVRVQPQMRESTGGRSSTTRGSSTTTRSTESGTSGRTSGGRR
ncbi:MAG: hypothetical protein Q4G48_00355 [Bacteroidia bacterium]|nr:hypothetical protein [Bacteroidia bacterium]